MKKIILILLAIVMMVSLVACANENKKTEKVEEKAPVENVEKPVEEKKSESEKSGDLETLIKTGKITMGTGKAYPPFVYFIEENGASKRSGIDVFVGEAIAKDLGIELEMVDMDFSAILAGVESGVIDMGISGISETPERKEVMGFSIPYLKSLYTFIVRDDDLGKYNSLEALKGATIGVTTASVQEALANSVEGAKVVSIPRTPDLIPQLQSGLIDIILTESTVADLYAIKNDGISSEKESLFENEAGVSVAIPKDSLELKEAIDKTIQKLIDEGKMEEFYNKALEEAKNI